MTKMSNYVYAKNTVEDWMDTFGVELSPIAKENLVQKIKDLCEAEDLRNDEIAMASAINAEV